MKLSILGIGTAVPSCSIAQRDAAQIVEGICCQTDDQRRLLPVIYRRSGVNRRFSVVLEHDAGELSLRQKFFPPAQSADDRGPTTAERMQHFEAAASTLAAAACRQALHRSDLSPARVTHLLTVTCSGFYAPGFDVSLFRDLPLPAETPRTQLGFMGCHGALNALRVARALASADSQALILVCCLELCSLHHQYGWDPDRIVANALFADGAAAILCSAREISAGRNWSVAANGSVVLPETTQHMGWRIGDHGFEMTLSAQVPEVIHRNLRPWLENWLARHTLSIDAIGCWAIHPGGPRILSACGEALGLDPALLADSQHVLSEFGNMSSPTVLFILERLRQRGASLPCVLLGFGPGLTIEAALIR